MNDLKFALRQLLKHPGFTAVAVLTLALGIGANTAIFTLVDAVLLKLLPVHNPRELVELGQNSGTSFSYPIFEQLRDRNQSFSGLLTVSKTPLRLTGDVESETVEGQFVSGNYFSLLGVRAWAGRTILPEDDTLSAGGSSAVAVISFGLWQRRFGADASAIGKQIMVEEKPFTIIGVTPPEFFGLQPGNLPAFWIPMAAEPAIRPQSWLRRPSFGWLSVVGRLKPGVAIEQARAELEVIFKQIQSEFSPEIKAENLQKISVESSGKGLSWLRRQFSKPLMVLMAMVGLVLLIACVNIANLLLARAASRRREFAVRLALGASRPRLIRQLLTESLLLSALGGLAGLLFAFWGSSFLLAMMSDGQTPVLLQLRPDAHVLVFATMVSLLTGLLFGLAPAFRTTRVDVSPALKENVRALSGGQPGAPVSKILVVTQVALSLVLVMGAGLFVGSLRNLKSLDAGFSRENVLLAKVNPAKAGYDNARRAEFYKQVLERTKRIPGIRSASFSWFTPIAGGGVDLSASVEGHTPQPKEDLTVYVNNVTPGYFKTLGTPILLGRDFSEQDTPNTPKVALINEAMAKYFFREANPIGRRVSFGRGEPMEIVGVVKDAKYMDLRENFQRTVYRHCLQSTDIDGSLTLEVLTAGSPLAFAHAVRNEIRALAGDVPVTGFNSLAAC
jgi:predicted permease